MEAPHGDLGCFVPRQWRVWNSNGNDGDEFLGLEHHSGNSGNANPGHLPPVPHGCLQYDVSALASWPPDPDLNSLGLDLSVYQPLDYVDETTQPIFEATSPPSLDAAAWALSSGESAFTGSSTTSDTECLSPYLLTHSPQVCCVPQLSASQTDCTAYGEDDIKDAAIASIPGAPRWPPSTQDSQPTGAPNAQHDGGSRPARESTREWRKRTKPVKCLVCGKGNPFQADLDKHMAAHHPDVARLLGIPTERHPCPLCPKDFARRDHVLRHRTQKHGREPTGRRRRPAQMPRGLAQDLSGMDG